TRPQRRSNQRLPPFPPGFPNEGASGRESARRAEGTPCECRPRSEALGRKSLERITLPVVEAFFPWWGRHSCLPGQARADRKVCPTTGDPAPGRVKGDGLRNEALMPATS